MSVELVVAPEAELILVKSISPETLNPLGRFLTTRKFARQVEFSTGISDQSLSLEDRRIPRVGSVIGYQREWVNSSTIDLAADACVDGQSGPGANRRVPF